ncbi:MAG: hypothetical protein CFE21_13180 [Bacteroidetes bacterium B1(2017)]|nr:MAG: hypothetical protein CFE21_13180 [Bacteroidetes bacterium B1(2017)]
MSKQVSYELPLNSKDATKVELRIAKKTIEKLLAELALEKKKSNRLQIQFIESEQRFVHAVKDVPYPMIIHTENGQILAMSRGLFEITGYDESEIRTMHDWAEKVYGATYEDILVHIKDLFNYTEFRFNGEFNIRCKNGSIKNWMISSFPFDFSDESNKVVISIANDITDTKKIKQTLEESESQLKRAEMVAGIGYWKLDLKTRLFYPSVGTQNIYGISADEITMEEVSKLHHPEYIELIDQALKGQILKGKQYDVEYKINRLIDNKEVFIHSKADKLIGDDFIFGVIQDISERKEIEAELRHNESKWKLIIEASPIAMAVNDSERNITYLNSSFIKLLGYTLNDIPTVEAWWPIAYPELTYRNYIKKVWKFTLDNFTINGGVFVPIECKVVCKNGIQKNILISASSIDSARGGDQLIIFYDITERVLAEKRLLQLSKAVEQSPVSIVITNLRGEIQYANPTFSQTSGFTLDEAIGQNPRILKSGETLDIEYKKLWETITNGKKWIGEFHNKRKNGELYWESALITPIMDEKGEIINFLAVKVDITATKLAQKALEESNERYNLVSMATHDTVWDLNIVTGELIRTDRALLGPTKFQHLNANVGELNWNNLVHPDDVTDFLNSQELVFTNPNAHLWEHEYRLLTDQGKFLHVNSKGYILRDENGNAVRMIGATQDISERVAHLEDTELQNKRLREIAWIQSHIVRAPLARIMGLVDLLLIEEDMSEETKMLLQNVLLSANEFDEIIKSIIISSQTVFSTQK